MNGIKAKIICDSVIKGKPENRITSIETKAPMFLDAEFEKHRRLSNVSSNSSSNRAIPLLKMLDKGYFLPHDIRLNKPGMQGDLLLDDDSKEAFWNDLKDLYGYTANILKKWDKVHKQHLNRYLAGFVWQTKICTGTEWNNFWFLRVDPAADPAMYDISKKMKHVYENSIPTEIVPGEYHLPYVRDEDIVMGQVGDSDPYCINMDDLLNVSAAGCARTSYDNHDSSNRTIEKDLKLANDLLKVYHCSPFEHQTTPMESLKHSPTLGINEWEKGVTHCDRNGDLWSNNFRGFIQYRAVIESI